ncbi:MAG: alginate export family protein, partial [Planctomycetota bacterium]
MFDVMFVRRLLCAAPVAAAACLCPAQAQDTAPAAPPPFERPAFSFLRQNEDWSGLRDADPSQLTDFWDSIKHVPLNDDGSVWASFGGSSRLRLESWSGFGFGAPRDDSDTFLLWRTLLHADVHFGENVRAFVQGKSALSTDRDLPGGRRTLDVDSLDLEQAFVDFRIPIGDEAVLTLRPGRQALLFGKQRLVSPLGWSNTLRRWDGVSGILKYRGWTVTGFWSQFAPVEKYEFNDPDRQTQLYGVYATSKLTDPGIGVDLYWLGFERNDSVTFNGTTGEEDRYTVGGRLWGDIGDSGFDYDFEGAWQYGEVGDGDVDAFMIGSQLGFRAADFPWSPRF